MARSSRAPARRPAPAPARRAASTSAPAPRPAAPAPAMQQQSSGGGMLSGIGSTIVSGMAFGTGSAIAHQAVGAVVGSMSGGRSAEPTPVAPQEFHAPVNGGGACGQDKQMFFDCLSQTKGDQQACSFLYENLQACQRNETTFQ